MAYTEKTEWNNDWTIKTEGIIKPISKKLEKVLIFLQKLEVLLDKAIEIIKIYAVGAVSWTAALLALILAGVRQIIAQISATGVYFLPMGMNTKAPDWPTMFQSIDGGFNGFMARLNSKITDFNDVNTPKLVDGSSYAGVLINVAFDTQPGAIPVLLKFFESFVNTAWELKLPVPTNIKVLPINNSEFVSSTADYTGSLFKSLSPVVTSWNSLINSENKPFDSLVVSWELPDYSDNKSDSLKKSLLTPASSWATDFIIEKSMFPDGVPSTIDLSDNSDFKAADEEQTRNSGIPLDPNIVMFEPDNALFTSWERIDYNANSAGFLLKGNKFSYVDNDVSPNTRYYYRIRSYNDYGNPGAIRRDYIPNFSLAFLDVIGRTFNNGLIDKKLAKYDKSNNRVQITYPSSTAISGASSVASGMIPPALPDNFSPMRDLQSALLLGFLCDFDIPNIKITNSGSTTDLPSKMIGYGVLTKVGRQLTQMKIDGTRVDEWAKNQVVRSEIRKIVNRILDVAYQSPQTVIQLAQRFTSVAAIVRGNVEWGSVYGWGESPIIKDAHRIRSINSFPLTEFSTSTEIGTNILLRNDNRNITTPIELVSAADRQALAEYLKYAVSLLNGPPQHLSWYSISLGQFIPSVSGFLFELEQFLASLIKAANDAVKSVIEMILSLQKRIEEIENIIFEIKRIVDLLNFNFRISILRFTGGGSNLDLVQQLENAENKPSDQEGYLPDGYSVGMLLLGAAPGPEIPAFKAIDKLLG